MRSHRRDIPAFLLLLLAAFTPRFSEATGRVRGLAKNEENGREAAVAAKVTDAASPVTDDLSGMESIRHRRLLKGRADTGEIGLIVKDDRRLARKRDAKVEKAGKGPKLSNGNEIDSAPRPTLCTPIGVVEAINTACSVLLPCESDSDCSGIGEGTGNAGIQYVCVAHPECPASEQNYTPPSIPETTTILSPSISESTAAPPSKTTTAAAVAPPQVIVDPWEECEMAKGSCESCVSAGCAYIGDSFCIPSCRMIADNPDCYALGERSYVDMTTSEICEIESLHRLDDAACSAKKSCGECVETPLLSESDGGTCRWLVPVWEDPITGKGTCTRHRSTMMGPAMTECPTHEDVVALEGPMPVAPILPPTLSATTDVVPTLPESTQVAPSAVVDEPNLLPGLVSTRLPPTLTTAGPGPTTLESALADDSDLDSQPVFVADGDGQAEIAPPPPLPPAGPMIGLAPPIETTRCIPESDVATIDGKTCFGLNRCDDQSECSNGDVCIPCPKPFMVECPEGASC